MNKMGPANKKIKSITSLLIIAILLPSFLFTFPKSADAFWGIFDFGMSIDPVTGPAAVEDAAVNTVSAAANTTETALSLKDVAKEIARQMLMTVARRALQEVTKSTVNWINSGFHGSPLFLENPDSFFKDIAKSEIKMIVDLFGYDTLRYPFGREFALDAINMYKGQLETNAAYTYSQVMTDPVLIKNYQSDFNTGGWGAFMMNTQYPQNNPIGFQMLATEELARRVTGTYKNAAEKVKETVQQGQGFLSPKMCPEEINPEYNNGTNEWRQPRFDAAEWQKKNPYEPPSETGACATDPTGQACQDQLAAYDFKYEGQRTGARQAFDMKNSCVKEDGTSGLVSTTPGSVVANQIMTSMSSNVRQSELGAALGNSLSQVFDALLNKFLQDGLNALASEINEKPKEDEWSYGGLTLGSPGEGGVNMTWSAGPDEPIILDDFKEKIAQGIQDTKEELLLMNNPVQVQFDPETGLVIDGPGLYQMYSTIWPRARELDMCLPGPDLGWEDRLKEEVDRNTKKLQSLLSGSSSGDQTLADATLKELTFAVKFFQDWVYNKMIAELPSSVLYLDAVKDIEKLSQEAKELEDAQRLRRQALARLQSIEKALAVFSTQPEIGSPQEKALITLWKQYKAVLVDVSNTITVEDTRNKLSTAKDSLNNLNKLTYECTQERTTAGWGTPGGPTSSYSGNVLDIPPTDKAMQKILNGLESNSEQALFCNLPIATGYTHEMFIGPGIANPPLPMVNAEKVMPYKVMTIKSVLMGGLTLSPKKTAYVNIQLSCNTIYKSSLLDYKGDLPGATVITETRTIPNDDTGLGDLGVCTFPDETEGESLTEAIMTKDDCEANGGEWQSIAPRDEEKDVEQ